MFRTFTNWVGNFLAALAVVVLLYYRLETMAVAATLVLALGYMVSSVLSKRPAGLYPASLLLSVGCVLAIKMTASPEAVVLFGLALILLLFAAAQVCKRFLGEGFRRPLDMGAYLSTFLLIALLFGREELIASYLLIMVGLAVYSGIYIGLLFLRKERWHLLPAAVLLSFVYYFFLTGITHVSGAKLSSCFLGAGLGYTLAAFLLARKGKDREATPLYLAAVAVTFGTTVVILLRGGLKLGTGPFLIAALVYGLTFIFTQRDELVYLITLTLGFMMYNRFQVYGDKFSLQLVDFLLYTLIALVILLLYPLARRILLRSKPFSFLIIKNWRGSVVYGAPVVVAIILIWAWHGLESTKNPYFCSTCHLADPLLRAQYDTWQTSSHKKVSCVKCHYPPGMEGLIRGKTHGIRHTAMFVTKAYDELQHAQIDDVSCLQSGCHVKEELYGPMVFAEKIKYDHEPHLTAEVRGMKLPCTSCHAHTVEENHFEVQKNSCFTCHLYGEHEKESSLSNCLTCHELPEETLRFHDAEFVHTKFFAGKPKEEIDCLTCHAEVTAGEGEVPAQGCFICHASKHEVSDIDQLHASHLGKKKLDCFECHAEIKHGLERKTTDLAPDCNVCHQTGHLTAEKVYMGEGGRDVENDPGPMYLANVDCEGCHRYDQPTSFGKLKKAGRQSCIDCHDEDYGDYLEVWQEDTAEGMAAVEAVLANIEGKLGTLEGEGEQAAPAEARKLYKRAKANYDLVKEDGSFGVHNKDYVDSLLEKAKKDGQDCMKLLESKNQ